MFSYFTGSKATADNNQSEAENVPTTRVETATSNGVRQEDPKYADMVLLPNKKKDDEDFLIKVPANNQGGNKKGGKGGHNSKNGKKNKAGAHTPTADSTGNFDLVTASAFDMAEVSGGKVPRYISKTHNGSGGAATNKGNLGGARCASGEEWVVVSPKKAQPASE